MLTVGETVSGYRIERLLGRGGMGSVYLAANPVLPRSDALKVLPAELSDDPDFRARFLREAELAATLNHPQIVSVYARGETDDGQLWIAMQFVDGTDADTALRAGKMTPRRAVHIVSEVAKGLDHAHSRKVVHRDVKPANFLLSGPAGPDEQVLLGDFGIARALDDYGLTMTGAVMATLSYAAPEVLSGEGLDQRADIYSLGCTLFRLLTGKTPFHDTEGGPAAVIAAHMYRPPPQVSALAPRLPTAMDDVIAIAMAKEPAARFPTARALAAAAADALNSRTGTSTTLPPVPATAVGPHRPLYPPPARPPVTPPPQPVPNHFVPQFFHGDPPSQPLKRTRRRGVVAAVAVSVVGVVLAGVAAAVWAGGDDLNAEPSPTAAAPAVSAAAPVTAAVAADALATLLLPAGQIPPGPDGQALTMTESPTWLFKVSNYVTPKTCGPAYAPGEYDSYITSPGYQGISAQRFTDGVDDGAAVFQSAVAFFDAQAASASVADQRQRWSACDGATISVGSVTGDPPRNWTFGQTTENADIVTIEAVREGGTRTCQHGVMAVDNVVIDVRQCFPTGRPDVGAIISKIALRVPQG